MARYDASKAETATVGMVHGHVLVKSDGRMLSWGPYGKIDNCIRPGDTADKWVQKALDTKKMKAKKAADAAAAAGGGIQAEDK